MPIFLKGLFLKSFFGGGISLTRLERDREVRVDPLLPLPRERGRGYRELERLSLPRVLGDRPPGRIPHIFLLGVQMGAGSIFQAA